MRIGLLGDIHGNSFALAAVLGAARVSRVEKLLITGDFVGYYFWPREVMDMLADWDLAAVRGNHEDMLVDAIDGESAIEKITAKYGSGLSMSLKALRPAQLDWLCHLPHPQSFEFDGRHLLLCHGSPWDLNQYVYPDAKADLLKRCAGSEYDWVVMGHTHYPMVQQVGNTVLVNPGSVGQPRNGVPAAHWALLDTSNRRLEFRVEPYDREPLIRECRLRHPELPYLAEILERTL
jgi:putative phosphoesterase